MSDQVFKSDGRLPLYQRLADALRSEIVDGLRRPGDRFPSENVLAEEYSMAAGTVRQALALLVSDGLLERIHGRGTFVRKPSFDSSLFRFFRFRDESGASTVPESRILRRTVEPIPTHVARQLKLKDGTNGISISRLRLIGDAPVLAEDIWLPEKPFRKFMDIPADDIGALLYPVYDTICNQLVARATEALTAEMANSQTARLLRVKEQTPLIVIERVAKNYSGTPLEWRRSRGRADHFHYQIEIR